MKYRNKNTEPKPQGFSFVLIALIIILVSLFIITIQMSHQQTMKNDQELQAGLHVKGNKIVNGKGQQVIFHGVDRSGTEYQCVQGGGIFSGPNDANSVQAIKKWNINVVRVPLNEDCWLGLNGANPSGNDYQQAITNYVNLINQNNMYVILDLHWNAAGTTKATGQQFMADKDHSLAFWTSVAQTFRGNDNVIFDLYNEPHDISWSCWKSGTNCHMLFAVAGMQDMVDAVRTTGATNILMISGLNYANDLSGFLANKPTDPLNNIVASWHMYGKNTCDTQSCWDTTVAPVMAQLPVVAAEFGESFDSTVCGTDLSNTFMNWMDQHNAGYLAWTWDTWGSDCSNLSLITNYDGTPKDPNGTNYKSHLSKFKKQPAFIKIIQ
jgi:endoglucanase